MHRICSVARFFEGFHQALGAVFGPGKNDGCIVAVLGKFFYQKFSFGNAGHKVYFLCDLICNLTGTRHGNPLWVFQVGVCQFVHVFWHGCRKQHCLAFFGKQRRDLAQRMDKAKIQHLVGFIEHQKLCL